MTMKKSAAVVAGAAMALAAAGVAVGQSGPDKTAELASKIDASKPKNVILLIGDGMGYSEVTLARNYAKGAAGRLNMDKLAFRGSSLHYVLRPGPGPTYAPNYVGDSAPTASAWSTGKRTQDNRLSQAPSAADNIPGTNEGYTTYMEMARDMGKATGNVSTAEITDATPAAPSSHISQRACQGPADTRTTCPTEAKTAATPGLGSIAEQQVDEGFDLYMGGGRARYEQPLVAGGTQNVIDYAKAKGYTYVDAKSGLDGVTQLESNGKRNKVLGLFNPSNMTTEWAPLYARTQAYFDANPGRNVQVQGGSATTKCQPQSRGNEPSLPEMTSKSLQLLEQDKDGFVLQVEGASIDKRDHAADVCGQIGETIAFDDAIGVALDYQAKHPDTLVIVSADHSHTSQMIGSGSPPATGAAYATLNTVDNAPIRIAYGTADTGLGATTSGSQSHTGAEVPVWASGPRAADIQGTIDQTDIFKVLTNVRGVTGNGDTSVPAPAGGTVPTTLALAMTGATPTFGAFQPGVARNYTSQATAQVTSSAGDATLSVVDPSATNAGRLQNGAFALATPLQVKAASGKGTGTAFSSLGSTPASLLTYGAPVSNDAVTIDFNQSIAANEALRTGAYSKTLTFTLSTTNP
jgi:alkaline phosphatase